MAIGVMWLGNAPISGQQEEEIIWDRAIITHQILPEVIRFLQLGLTSMRSQNIPELYHQLGNRGLEVIAHCGGV